MFRTIYTELGWDPIHDKIKATRMEFQDVSGGGRNGYSISMECPGYNRQELVCISRTRYVPGNYGCYINTFEII